MALSLTVDVEEWYHDLWPGADKIIMEYYHHKLPKGTFIKPLRLILQMLERQRVHSTFFILGESAEACPEIVEEIYDMGHEVASHGLIHRDLTKTSLGKVEESERRNRDLLWKTTGEKPQGFRAPLFKVNSNIISILERVGYEYDSSVVPSINIPGWFGYYNAPLYPYRLSKQNLGTDFQRKGFFEVPIAVYPYLRLPTGGGWFLRNLGLRYVEMGIKLLLRKKLPAILYIHPLDVFPNVPWVPGIPFHVTRRCGEYTLKAVEHILRTFSCKKMSITDILQEFCGAG